MTSAVHLIWELSTAAYGVLRRSLVVIGAVVVSAGGSRRPVQICQNFHVMVDLARRYLSLRASLGLRRIIVKCKKFRFVSDLSDNMANFHTISHCIGEREQCHWMDIQLLAKSVNLVERGAGASAFE